ncbi:MAG: hypothetical protein ACM3JK_07160 [Betaproteobacteria bacterium]
MARFIPLLASTCLLWHSTCIGAEPIGRLFFYPEERAMLDQMRNKDGAISTPAEQIRLNGIVRRSDGKNTVWINQQPQHENRLHQGIAIPGQDARPSAILTLPSGGQVRLKAGQTFDAVKGQVREGYEETISAPPARATKQ